MISREQWIDSRVLRWALYDIASSNFHAVVPTFFGLYFVSVIGQGDPAAKAWWGATAAAGLLVAAILAPLVGAWADRTGRWFAALAVLTLLCVVATVLLPGAAHAGLLAGCVLFIAAQACYTVASSLYDSLVIDVAPAGRRGLASAVGWSLGLAGGLASVFAALALVQGLAPEQQLARLDDAFLIAGALFGLLAIPGLLGVRRARPASPYGPAADFRTILATVASTLRHWRAHREPLKVIAAFFLVNDVLVTLQFFAAVVLASGFGIAVEGILRLLIMATLIAIPATIGFGVLADRWGSRRSIAVMCLGLAAAVLLLAFSKAAWTPTAAFVLLGFVYGSVQAVFRGFFASLVPANRASELFGFNAVAGRLSAVAGPLIFGVVAAAWGSSVALLTLIVPLLLGIGLLARVNVAASGAASDPSSA